MNKSLLPILSLFVLVLSITSLPVLVYGDPVPTNGTTPATQWVPAGPASNIIRYQFYTSDADELSAMCVGQAPGCVPALDLSDVPIGGNDLSPASGCVPSSTHVCAISDPRFWVTAPTIQLGQLQLDINNAASFWGITFCNGHDGVTAGSTNNCPSGAAGANIAATCPGATPANDCSKAAINVRQGFASLIDKVAFTIADKGAIGPGAAAMDNPLTPASATLHSGQDLGNNNPCLNPAPGTGCTAGLANCGGTACNPTGPYSAVVNTGVIPPALQTVAPGTAGAFNLGGVCSWDTIAGCSPTLPISAFHYANDAVDSAGFVVPGSVDFCRAADHFIAAGLATTKNSLCELTNESPALANGNILFYGRVSLGRQLLSTGYTVAICELVNLGATSCPQVTLNIISLAQAHQLVFKTGCKLATEPGCNSVGPNTGWQLYAGGYFFATPTPDNQWAIYDSAFAADLCNATGSPGLEPGNYDFVCNARMDTYQEQSQFLGTPAAATASLQIAMDIFGNHTFNVMIWTPSIQYAYTKGWNGVSNAAGIGTAQGNTWSLLNAWNANPQTPGPTIRWGQKDATSSLNPFSFNTVVEADIVNEVYDSLLVTNPQSPTQIIGWMANFYQKVAPVAGSPTCPTSYTNSRGTFTVATCVQIQLRGEIPFHDVYNCAASDLTCLTTHTVTANDVKFSFANFNATGSLITPSTSNTIDVVYNTNQLPTALGGTKGQGETETLFILLHSDSAYALNDITGIPILPQRLWVTQTAPKLANGVFAPCTTLGTVSCTVDPAFTAGTQSDPILANKFIGTGPFMCASGTPGVSGTVIGGGCAFDSTGTPTGQAIPVGGTAILRRFLTTNGLDQSFSYMRTSSKFQQFQWAAFPGGSVVPANAFTVAIAACKANAAAVGGVNNYAGCQHYNTKAGGLACAATAGTCNAIEGGGSNSLPNNPIPVLIQLSHWRNNGPWAFGAANLGALVGSQALPQTLYENGNTLGSFTIASSSATIATTVGVNGMATISVSLSGGPDNNFTAPVTALLATVQSTGLTATLTAPSIALTPGAPTGSTTLTVSAAAAGTYTVFVKASQTAFPSVTVAITVTVT
jgi:hypothetical protein